MCLRVPDHWCMRRTKIIQGKRFYLTVVRGSRTIDGDPRYIWSGPGTMGAYLTEEEEAEFGVVAHRALLRNPVE